jgi:anti-sigma factor RsiW
MTTSGADDPLRLLNAALDGELDAAGMMAVESMTAADPRLAAEFRRLQALQAAIRTRLPRENAPDRFRAQIAAMAGPAPEPQVAKARPKPRFDQRIASLAAMLLFGIVIGAGGYRQLAPAENDADDAVVSNYIRGRLSGQPVDVATSDRHTVKPWLAGKVAGATTVVDLKSDGFPLSGGRVDVIGTTPVATLMYQRREHQIALSEMTTNQGALAPRLSSRDGFALLEWREEGRRYVAVSDLPPAEMTAFGEAFRRAAAAEREVTPKP